MTNSSAAFPSASTIIHSLVSFDPMIPLTRCIAPRLASTVLCALLLLGCDNSIEPFAREGAYSIYGYLSLSRSDQFIRVKPLNEPLTTDAPQPLDATVTLDNISAGTSEVLEDSILVFEDEGTRVITHNFWTDTPVQPKAEYRITIEGPNGTTQATTTTPTGVDPTVTPDSSNCLTRFTVTFRDIKQPPLFAEFRFHYDGQRYRVRVLEENSGSINGTFTYQFIPENILMDDVPPPEQPSDPFAFAPRCLKLEDDEIQFTYVYASPDWIGELPTAGEAFDPTINQEDIINGAGFFGALRRGAFTVTVDTSQIIRRIP